MKNWYLRPQFTSRKRKNDDDKYNQTDAEVFAWNNLIEDDDVLNELSLEAQKLWETHGGDQYSAKSFWVLKEEAPKCLLEKFALQMGSFHSYNTLGDEDAFIGVEFWVQYREGNYNNKETEHGLEFHFDKDEVAAKERDEWYHPTFSTVTYLPVASTTNKKQQVKKAGGVPLVIFSTESLEEGQKSRPRPQQFPKYSWTVPAQPNRHVMFSGNLLHGCPSDLIEPMLSRINGGSGGDGGDGDCVGHGSRGNNMDYARLSLAVNIWTKHEPDGLQRLDSTALFSAKTNNANSTNSGDNGNATNSATGSRPVRVADIQIDATDVLKFKKVKCDSRMDFDDLHFVAEHKEGDTAPLPLPVITEEFRKSVSGDDSNTVVAVKYFAT